MNWIFAISHLSELPKIIQNKNCNEVLIRFKVLSRFGELHLEDLTLIVTSLPNHRLILDFDILFTDRQQKEIEDFWAKIPLDKFVSVRVQDAGAVYWSKLKCQLPLQLVLETGHQNLLSIKRWVQFLGERLQRVVLSHLIPKDELQLITREIKANFELQVFGAILIFYSPRSLLKPIQEKKEVTRALANSEESPHRGFYLLENQHGTFMFLPKFLNTLDFVEEFPALGIEYARIETQFLPESLPPFDVNQWRDMAKDLNTTQGFYRVNKTDVNFKKLKNQKVQRQDEDFIGQIIDVNKGIYVALQILNPNTKLKLGDSLFLMTPEGREIHFQIHQLKNLMYEDIDETNGEMVVLLNPVGRVGPKTLVYYPSIKENALI